MYNPKNNQQPTTGLFGKLKGILRAAEALASAPAPIAPPVRKAAPQPANRMKTTLALAPKAAATQPLAQLVTAPVVAKAPTSKEELSASRQAVIANYLEQQVAFPEMEDPRFMYRVVAEEHAFQTARLVDLQERVRFAGGRQAAEMKADICTAAARVANLAQVRKHIIEMASATRTMAS
ncbi:MAG: hypothetical protein JWM80_5451 [Cyanobacteria bacterium RYN_339]|nr:hypothetical protein [Cyanobacteria bacterium RYN_339]